MTFDEVWNQQLMGVRVALRQHGGAIKEEGLKAICQIVYSTATETMTAKLNQVILDSIVAATPADPPAQGT